MTIHDVPDETRVELAARAARAGQSLEEYVRGRLVALAQRPSPDTFGDRVGHRVLVTGSALPADSVLDLQDADRR